MGAVLELLAVPILLVTLAAIVLGVAGLSATTLLAFPVALALFYVVVLCLLWIVKGIDDDTARSTEAGDPALN